MVAGGGIGDSVRRREFDDVVARWRTFGSVDGWRGDFDLDARGGVEISEAVETDLMSSSDG